MDATQRTSRDRGRSPPPADAGAAGAQVDWGAVDGPSLASWLDAALRPGSDVSVAADLPFLMQDSDRVARRVLVSNGRPVAHAAALEIAMSLPSGPLRAAVIGAVATDPEHRRRGLGTRAIEALADDLRQRGVALAILWADVKDFYERLGFVLAGRESVFHCPRWKRRASKQLAVRPATEADLPAIASLHDREICRAVRDEAAWRTLFGIPRTDFYVVERDRRIVAYGVVGKGHDLAGCLHEWGGDELLLPILVSGIFGLRFDSELYVMSPPWKHQSARAMAFHGIVPHPGALGMLKVLDREALLASLGLTGSQELPDDDADLIRTVFGYPAGPESREGSELPVPFYLFGLDSM